jgi:hypothetical protein
MGRWQWALVAAGALVLVFTAAYFGSPWLAVNDLKSAAVSGDRDRLEQDVDFPAVRESLKSQFSAAMLKAAKPDPNNPFAALGAVLVPALADRMIDTYLTPDALANMIKRGQAAKPDSQQASGDDNDKVQAVLGYRTLDRFRAQFIDPKQPDEALSLIFERRGWFTWKLIRIDLPETLFSGGDGKTDTAANDSAATNTQSTADQSQEGVAGDQIGANSSAAPDSATDADSGTASMQGYAFSTFPSQRYSGPVALPDFAGKQRPFREFRTRILEGIKDGPAFAGNLAISLFGCGTDCAMGYVMNLRTGDVYDLPVGGEVNSDLDLSYHVESRLMKASWKGEDPNNPACAGYAYLEWTGAGFKTLERSALSPNCPPT